MINKVAIFAIIIIVGVPLISFGLNKITYDENSLRSDILDELNRVRSENKLQQLVIDDRLLNYTETHAKRMQEIGLVHSSNIPAGCSEIIQELGDTSISTKITASTIIENFMDSTLHRELILQNYNENIVGIGIDKDSNVLMISIVIC